MTVHAIEVVAGEPQFATYQDLIDEANQRRKQLHEALTEERFDASVVENDPLADRPEHLRAFFRFSLNDDAKPDFIDPIARHLDDAGAAWYRIRYHKCDHDDEHGDCDWTYERNEGAVPGDV